MNRSLKKIAKFKKKNEKLKLYNISMYNTDILLQKFLKSKLEINENCYVCNGIGDWYLYEREFQSCFQCYHIRRLHINYFNEVIEWLNQNQYDKKYRKFISILDFYNIMLTSIDVDLFKIKKIIEYQYHELLEQLYLTYYLDYEL